MANMCMVLSGHWRCSTKAAWEFSVDKQRLSRVILLQPGLTFQKLQKTVAEEFGWEGYDSTNMSLSYWPVNIEGLATNTKTPPVMLTSDAAVSYFMAEFELKNTRNMFVHFRTDTEAKCNESVGADNQGFTTPVCTKTRMMDFDLNDEATPTADIPTAVLKVGPGQLTDDDLITFIEEEEAREQSGSRKGPWDLGINSVSSDDDDDINMEDVIPTPGYDHEFWEPFLEEEHGGSRAADVMFGHPGASTSNITVHFHPDMHRIAPVSTVNPSQSGEHLLSSLKRNGGHVHEDKDTTNDANAEQRNLADIDDEEFDIPPLFDDTEFDLEGIPDLDKFDDDHVIKVGNIYKSRSDLQISLALYSIKNMVHHVQSRTKKDYVVFSCSDARCDWRVTAREMINCGYYKIRKAYLHHTCSLDTRNRYREKATSKVIASVYKAKFGTPGVGPLAMDLQQMVLQDLRVNISYMKGWRSKDKAQSLIWGTEEESYEKLPTFLHLLKATNPGTVTALETVREEDNTERFKYVFLAFGASIKGFKFLRRVLVVDGTHLTGKHKGVLLTASGQDSNFQVFPLAFAVVDSENDDSWTWFMKHVEKIIGDGDDLTIISDRCQSIYKAKAEAFPRAKHAACVVHMERNVISRFKRKGLGKLFTEAAFAFKVGEFNQLFGKLRHESSNCAKYLEKIGLRHWSRAYFQGNRYNLMTSNIAESLNNAIKKGRSSPIVELLRFIQAMMTRWFSARRKKSSNHKGGVTVEVEKVMIKNKCNFVGSKVNRISDWSFEVIGIFGSRNQVHLDTRRCTCRAYDLLQIPCGHALVAADYAGINYDVLVPGIFKTYVWVDTYLGFIYPAGDKDNVIVPTELATKFLIQPKTKRPPGREKEGRIPSGGEIKDSKVVTKTAPNKCGRCRGVGHNRTSCKNPI